MTEDSSPSPWPERRDWGRAFEHAEVVGVEILATEVRVRLRSGVELEWPLNPPGWDRNTDDIA